jgi:hypothetical protein
MGFIATFDIVIQSILNRYFYITYVVYYADLTNLKFNGNTLKDNMSLFCRKNKDDIQSDEFIKLIGIRGIKLVEQQLQERFASGSKLWFLKSNNEILAFRWTINNNTIESHFFPISKSDIHLFDCEVLEEFRGKGNYGIFTDALLNQLKNGGYSRAYAETRIWNKSLMNSVKKTNFCYLGRAKKFNLFGKIFIIWNA